MDCILKGSPPPPRLFKASLAPLSFTLDAPSTCNIQGLMVNWSFASSVLTTGGDSLVKEHYAMKLAKVWPLIAGLG
jgi:hypothetical protein